MNRQLTAATGLLALAMGLACGSSSKSGTSAAGQSSNPTYTVSGTVRDPSGSGVPGVVVMQSGTGSPTATTDSSGKYSLPGVAPGTYTLTPSKSGFTFTPATRDVTVAAADVVVDFDTAKATHSISGTVTGTSGVTVSVTFGNTTLTFTPTDSGTYGFYGLADGDYTVTPSKSGFTFTPASRAVSLSGADATAKDFAASAVVTPTYRISGTAGLAGATVTLSGANTGSAIADPSGNYSFANLQSGAYFVTPSKLGYRFSPTSAAVAVNGADVAVPAFKAIVARHTISGTITGGSSVAVTVNGATTAATTTDSSGRYSFIGLPDGDYEVMPSKPGYSFTPAGRSVRLDGANATLQDFLVSAHGWGFISPSMKPTIGMGVWNSGPNDVWVVGYYSGGQIEHWDGTYWSDMAVPTTSNLFGVWGSGPGDVWAVGDSGTIVHWDGSSWFPMVSGTTKYLYGVWGSGPSDVWAVGPNWTAGEPPALLHWDGFAWSSVPVPGLGAAYGTYLNAVWGSGPDDVWAVGWFNESGAFWEGGILHWDGTSWKSVKSGTRSQLVAVWGSGPNDVWAGGQYGTLLHWDGTLTAQGAPVWKHVLSTETDTITGIWGSGPDDVWLVNQAGTVQHWDGKALARLPTWPGNDPRAIHGSGPNDVWVTGNLSSGASLVRHWDGTTWSSATNQLASGFGLLWGLGANDIWAVGNSYSYSGGAYDGMTFLHWDGTAWTDKGLKDGKPVMPNLGISGLFGAASDDVWAVGQNGLILHWDGTAWAQMTGVTTANLIGIYGTSRSDVWAVGPGQACGGIILHWNGVTWEDRSKKDDQSCVTTRNLSQVWASGQNDVWITDGNSSGKILHWDGANWNDVALPANALGVWGSSSADVWAVFNGSAMRTTDGGVTWTTYTVPWGWYWHMWGSGADDIWAMSWTGTPMHWDGNSWTSADMATNVSINSVWGASASDHWAVASYGYILRSY